MHKLLSKILQVKIFPKFMTVCQKIKEDDLVFGLEELNKMADTYFFVQMTVF
jgi:hypothetical protein